MPRATVLETWTLSDPSDIIGQTVGGNRYGWLVTNDFATLALDNVTRVHELGQDQYQQLRRGCGFNL